MRLVLPLLALVACDDKSDPDLPATSPDPTPESSAAPTPTAPGTPADGLFFSATGTVSGQSATFSCDENSEPGEFYATQNTDGAGTYQLGGACNSASLGDGYSFNIGVLATGPKSGTECEPGTWGIQVLDLFGGTGYNCALNGTTDYSIDLTELTVETDGSVTWGGMFTVEGASDSMAVDLSGSFRFNSP